MFVAPWSSKWLPLRRTKIECGQSASSATRSSATPAPATAVAAASAPPAATPAAMRAVRDGVDDDNDDGCEDGCGCDDDGDNDGDDDDMTGGSSIPRTICDVSDRLLHIVHAGVRPGPARARATRKGNTARVVHGRS